MNQYEKLRAQFKEETERPGKVFLTTALPAGQNLGFISFLHTFNLASPGSNMPETIALSQLQNLADQRGGNVVGNLKVSIMPKQGSGGSELFVFATGEVIKRN